MTITRVTGAAILAAVALSAGGQAHALTIASPAFVNGGVIPNPFTNNVSGQCSGSNWSPPLEFRDIPAGTQSLALVVTDSDAGDLVHWKAWNIPPSTTTLPYNAAATASFNQGWNGFGAVGYGGPCPPEGSSHQYVFTLHALNTVLAAEPPEVELAQAAIATATLTGVRSPADNLPWAPPLAAMTPEALMGMHDPLVSIKATGNGMTLTLNGRAQATPNLASYPRVELWASASPYTGNPMAGTRLFRWDAARGGATTPALPVPPLPDGNYYLSVIGYEQTSELQTRPPSGLTPSCIIKNNNLNNETSTDTRYCAFDVDAFDNFRGSLRCSGGKCITSTVQAGAVVPETGWWWNPAESGRGLMLEVSKGWLYLSFHLYDADGEAVWYTASGALSAGGEFSAQLLQMAGGQTLTGSYIAPTVVNSAVGVIRIQFVDGSNGTLTLPDNRQIPITRFRF